MASIENIITDLEKKGKDEHALLLEVGPSYFTTADLIRLLGQWEIKSELFKRFQQSLVWLGASAPAWLLIATIGYFIKLHYLTSFALVMFPVTAFLCFGGLIWINIYFKGKGYLEQIEVLIREELEERKGKK
ncbi:MAG: hypothetical protein AAFZ15_04825 [Bacteroidota bacterium]